MFSPRKSALAGSLVLGAGLLLAPTVPTASADTRDAQACPGDPYYTVERIKTAYEPIGSTAGKRNAASSTSRLTYALATTVSKATAWSVELGGSMEFAVATVEAKAGVEVTKSVERGRTVTNWMDVPGGKYGYTTPKIQRSTYVIEKWMDKPNCSPKFMGNMGTLKAITAYPFFSECVSTGPCTPKP